MQILQKFSFDTLPNSAYLCYLDRLTSGRAAELLRSPLGRTASQGTCELRAWFRQTPSAC